MGKPDLKLIRETMKLMESVADSTIMVGDSLPDIDGGARNTEILSVSVDFGYVSKYVKEFMPVGIAPHFNELASEKLS